VRRSTRYLAPVLWGLALCAGGLSAAAWRDVVPRRAPHPRPALPASPPVPAASPGDSLRAAAAAIVAADPFRLDRRPAAIPYRAELGTVPDQPPPSKPPKPALAVAGIIGGPPWAALLEGVPGRDGTVLVHAGAVVEGLRVRSVTADHVIITGIDTTWSLTLKRPWP
jgi:hypothetical protein